MAGTVAAATERSLSLLCLLISVLCRRCRRHRRISCGRALHVIGVALIADRSGNRPQTDFSVVIAVTRIGLLMSVEVVSIH